MLIFTQKLRTISA